MKSRNTASALESSLPGSTLVIERSSSERPGELAQPACTKACPTEATIFGDREGLLAEARRRIHNEPDKYIDHIWGEHEVGGTSVLTISDVNLTEAGWVEGLGSRPRPVLARKVLHTVPYTFFGVAGLMYGVHWTLDRRRRVAAAEGPTMTTDAEGADARRNEEES